MLQTTKGIVRRVRRWSHHGRTHPASPTPPTPGTAADVATGQRMRTAMAGAAMRADAGLRPSPPRLDRAPRIARSLLCDPFAPCDLPLASRPPGPEPMDLIPRGHGGARRAPRRSFWRQRTPRKLGRQRRRGSLGALRPRPRHRSSSPRPEPWRHRQRRLLRELRQHQQPPR